MRFANDFHSWLRHSWKLLANRLTRDPKIVIHGNSCIILYILICYEDIHKSKKQLFQSSMKKGILVDLVPETILCLKLATIVDFAPFNDE